MPRDPSPMQLPRVGITNEGFYHEDERAELRARSAERVRYNGGHTLGAAGPGRISLPGSGAPLCPVHWQEARGRRHAEASGFHHGRPSG